MLCGGWTHVPPTSEMKAVFAQLLGGPPALSGGNGLSCSTWPRPRSDLLPRAACVNDTSPERLEGWAPRPCSGNSGTTIPAPELPLGLAELSVRSAPQLNLHSALRAGDGRLPPASAWTEP